MMTVVRRNPLTFCAALLVLLWLARGALFDPRYRVDGQCMTHDAGSITVRTASRGGCLDHPP
jgi:hypothetical protein